MVQMTTTDQPLSIDEVLNEPVRCRGWVIGRVLNVDQAHRQCLVADRTGDTVTVSYRSKDTPIVLAALNDRDEAFLKALGLCEYQSGSVLSRMLQVERLFAITQQDAEHPTALGLYHDLRALQTHPGWNRLPADLAENHDEYIARAIHGD